MIHVTKAKKEKKLAEAPLLLGFYHWDDISKDGTITALPKSGDWNTPSLKEVRLYRCICIKMRKSYPISEKAPCTTKTVTKTIWAFTKII